MSDCSPLGQTLTLNFSDRQGPWLRHDLATELLGDRLNNSSCLFSVSLLV